jgi:hypothetical protein
MTNPLRLGPPAGSTKKVPKVSQIEALCRCL